MEDKILFYKNRTLDERFSVTAAFLRQNWKVLLKNILYIAIPLAFFEAFLESNMISFMLKSPILYIILKGGVSILLNLFLISMTGAILSNYLCTEFGQKVGWSDLKTDFFSIMGKIFAQQLVILCVVIIIALACFFLFENFGIVLLGLLIIIFYPLLSLVYYPIIFEDESATDGLQMGFQLGLRNYIQVFVTAFIAFILMLTIFLIPTIIGLLKIQGLNILSHFLSGIATVIVYPVSTIFIAFQYTALIEKEENISLQDEVEDFNQM